MPAVLARAQRFLLITFLLALPGLAFSQAQLTEIAGRVEISDGAQSWQAAASVPLTLREGSKVRTARGASATLAFPDGSSVKLGANAVFALQSARAGKIELILSLGALRAFVRKNLSRSFSVRTPAAVCAVRGTEFLLEVQDSQAVQLEVFEGVVAVKTLLGEELEVGDGRQLRGLRMIPDQPLELPAADAPRRQQTQAAPAPAGTIGAAGLSEDVFKKDVRNEVALSMSKDEVQAAAAVEARRAQYQEGKTMIDSSGVRVRIEEYIVRPAADTMKFVVLNSRADSLNYFYYQAQFNQALPEDLAPALRFLGGKTGTAPAFFITAFETGRSNTIDKIQENGTGGHLVNAALAANKVIYDPETNAFTTVAAGTNFWSTLFDNYSYRINGREKYGWQPAAGSNITSYDYVAGGINTRILGGAGFGGVTCASSACETTNRPSTVSQPEGASRLHDRVTINYTDGTSERYDFLVINDEGRVATAADFGNITSGAKYKDTLLKFNYEQIITATEFQGRTIDLVVEPKILVKSGLIP